MPKKKSRAKSAAKTKPSSTPEGRGTPPKVDVAQSTASHTRPTSSDKAKHVDAAQKIRYEQYDPAKEEVLLPAISDLISGDLSEPYSIYVYRYFLYEWGRLCFVVCIICLLYL